jgi:hypothetical protein
MVNNGKPEAVGFPPISWGEEALATRPLPLHELPVQVGIDMAMALIDTHHAHIGKAIRVFWGSRDCVEYMQKLVLSGGDGLGHARVGFKPEVVTALMSLVTIHNSTYASAPSSRL